MRRGHAGLLAGSLAAKTGRDAAPEQTLSIKVYDQAEVPAATLKAATAETGRLFRAAGIRISWQHPATESPEDVGTDMTRRKRSGSQTIGGIW